MSLDEYDERLKRQGGVCAICRTPERYERLGKTLNLAVDHDRRCCPGDKSCGSCLRDLLCQACNRGIGLLADDPQVVEAAAAYLRKHGPIHQELV